MRNRKLLFAACCNCSRDVCKETGFYFNYPEGKIYICNDCLKSKYPKLYDHLIELKQAAINKPSGD